MKSCITTHNILVLLILFASTNAAGQWGINPICPPTASTFLANEFGLVHSSALSMKNNLNTPNEVTNTLVEYMFGTEQENYEPISFPRAVFGGGEGITGLANIGGPIHYESLGQNDVMVFCNMQHLFPPVDETPTRWYDSAFHIYRNDGWGGIRACYNGEPSNGLPPPNAMLMNTPAGQPQALIFCSWFIERGMSAQFADGRTFNSDFLARARAYKAKFGLPRGATNVDWFYLFDSTFMHELTHSVFGGSKSDVQWPNSYRWANARRISTIADPQTGAPDNVDNYIMLKLANDLTAYGYTVNADGSIIKPST